MEKDAPNYVATFLAALFLTFAVLLKKLFKQKIMDGIIWFLFLCGNQKCPPKCKTETTGAI